MNTYSRNANTRTRKNKNKGQQTTRNRTQAVQQEALTIENELNNTKQAELQQNLRTQDLDQQKVQLAMQADQAAAELESLEHQAASAVQQMQQAEVVTADVSLVATGFQQNLNASHTEQVRLQQQVGHLESQIRASDDEHQFIIVS